MFSFKGKVVKYALKKSEFTKTLDEACQVQLRQAARAFLRAALTKIPLYTGMTQGSLVPMARLLGVSLHPKITELAAGHGHKDRTADGERMGKKAFKFKNTKHIHSFEFNIPDFYFRVNEFERAPASFKLTNETPWHSFDEGLAAFNAYLSENLVKRAPRLKDYVVTTTTEIT